MKTSQLPSDFNKSLDRRKRRKKRFGKKVLCREKSVYKSSNSSIGEGGGARE